MELRSNHIRNNELRVNRSVQGTLKKRKSPPRKPVSDLKFSRILKVGQKNLVDLNEPRPTTFPDENIEDFIKLA
jgi:hypothetical protein